MSFEGFYQITCKNGHEFEKNIYDTTDDICDICGEKFQIKNLIDETNGNDDISFIH